MGMLTYYSSAAELPDFGPDTLVARIPAGITQWSELLRTLGQALHFPPWAGRNFDAAWECICLLDNIAQHDVVIIHADIPALEEDWTNVYLALMADTVQHWSGRAEHSVTIYFPR